MSSFTIVFVVIFALCFSLAAYTMIAGRKKVRRNGGANKKTPRPKGLTEIFDLPGTDADEEEPLPAPEPPPPDRPSAPDRNAERPAPSAQIRDAEERPDPAKPDRSASRHPRPDRRGPLSERRRRLASARHETHSHPAADPGSGKIIRERVPSPAGSLGELRDEGCEHSDIRYVLADAPAEEDDGEMNDLRRFVVWKEILGEPAARRGRK